VSRGEGKCFRGNRLAHQLPSQDVFFLLSGRENAQFEKHKKGKEEKDLL